MMASSYYRKAFQFFLFYHFTIFIQCEIFTSVQELTQVFTMERRVVDALAEYLTKTELQLDRIRRYLKDYEQVRAEGIVGGQIEFLSEKLAGNPIHAFHLMKRLTVDWKHINSHAPFDQWQNVERAIVGEDAIEGLVRLPKEEDLHGATQALVRLQSIYQLNTSSLVRGEVDGIQTKAELRAQDCLYMGKHSFNMGMYFNAIEWFEEAHNLAGMEGNSTLTQDQVMDFINTAVKAYDESRDVTPLELNSKSYSSIKSNSFSILKTEKIEQKIRKYEIGPNLSKEEDFDNFKALCRGEPLLSNKYKSKLKCRFDNLKVPYLMLMPVKIEVQHLVPEILVFHDVINDQQIESMKSAAKSQLSRAMVQGVQGKGNTVSPTRTSKVAWITNYDEERLLGSINRRISYMTGLLTDLPSSSAEPLQIANYGTGGHYNPHFDYLLADKTPFELKNNLHARELEMGDRLGTFMFYLSDVTRGGATVFPKLGVSLWPKKGSAAFWHNLRKSGQGDKMTLHGACPVVHGSKWVGNKWIRERTQFRNRPCGLSPEE